jgi:hypothetical protein
MAIDTTASCDAGRLADLFERHGISPVARHEIKLCINLYLSGAGNLGPDTAAAFADATRLRAEPRFVVAKAKKDVAAAIDVPSAFDPMHKAAVALSDLVNRVGVDRVVSIFARAEHLDAPDAYPDELAQAIRDRLERMLDDLDWLASRVTAVRKYKKPLKRGRKSGRQVVEMVAAVIERDTGQRIKRSKNKDSLFALLTEIVHVVGIGSGTVEEVVRGRRKRLRRGEISTQDAE